MCIIDTKLPECGELLLKRVILGFRNAYRTRDRSTATVLVKFIAHLVNQQIAHEVLALQLVTILLEKPTKEKDKKEKNKAKKQREKRQIRKKKGIKTKRRCFYRVWMHWTRGKFTERPS